jgi:hypothetical protein
MLTRWKFVTFVCLFACALNLRASIPTQANVPVEITFTAKAIHVDPFNDTVVDVVFTEPDGNKLCVPAFWDGGAIWKVRYASPKIGTHRWVSECNDQKDHGLQGIQGSVLVSPYHGANAFYQHGPIRVAADHRHFEHLDGAPFFWLGDTWWMGLCHRLHFPDEFEQLTADRVEKGFNVVQIVAGLYPDMFPFDARGANEAGFPWETNYTRINPKYFDAADKRLGYLVDEGISPCIVGAWGYFLPWMGVEKAKQHWRYLIARYGAWPVTWCVAGEDNLPWYLAKDFPYDDREQAKGWTEVARYVRKTDPFHRMLTIHPTGIGPCDARHAVSDDTVLDYNMLQTPHGQREAVAPTFNIARAAYEMKPTMAIMNGEASYERLSDTIATEWTRAMFWISMMNGAAGHTYGANGIWQCNRREQPHGASPHGGNYGKISWDEAMVLPGSGQVGAGKEFLEQFAWRSCVPMHATVAWATAGDARIGPCALGHSNDMRIIYAIAARPVVVSGLRAKTKFHYTAFDPVGGNSAAVNELVSDETGKLTIQPPTSHDWIAILETENSQRHLEPLLQTDDGKAVITARQWKTRRAELKQTWEQVLGKFPSHKSPLRTEVLNREVTGDFIREHIRYQIEDGLYTDAYLLTPKKIARKNPAIVVFHPTTPVQARGVAGLASDYPEEKWQGVQLVKRGYIVLCPRNYIYGEGTDWTGNANRVIARHPDWTGITEMTWDAIRAADLLQSLPHVDKNRIGCLGHSLGGKQALYAAAFDERYKACVASELGIGLNSSNWNSPWYFGDALQDRPELDNHQVLALIAPRPFLLLAGDSADTDNSLHYIDAVAPVYELLEAETNLHFVNHREGHRYSPEARDVAEKFLDDYLKK